MKDYDYYKLYSNKRQKNLPSQLADPHILIVKTHHATEYYDALTLEGLYKTALFILEEFNNQDLLIYDDEEPQIPPVTKSVFEQMPNCNAKTLGLSDWKHYEGCLAHYTENQVIKNRINLCLSQKHAVVAYQILCDLCRWGYNEPMLHLERIMTVS